MGANKTKVTGFRIEDESILKKLGVIATKNCRTRNKEVEYALKKYVEQYENLYGEIQIEEQEKEEPSQNIKIKNSKNFIVGDNSTINM